MIVTPLIIWFLAPLVIGGVIGYLGGYALSKLVEYVIKVRHLSLEALREQKRQEEIEKKQLLEDVNRLAKNNLNSNNHNKINLRDFIAEEEGNVYTGNIDKKGNLTSVALIEYKSIDYSLNKQLNELPDDKVLLI